VVLDHYTVRCHLYQPSAAFPADVVYYPCNLIAPDSEKQADIHLIFLSTSPAPQEHSGFRNERIDKLIVEARHTAATRKRLELYTEIESLINEALPVLYMHHLTLLEAGSMRLQGYQPAISGFFSTKGAGLRVAWLA
jgi:ABC-type transport system substrate-binding protein